jgi:hypothetical protein
MPATDSTLAALRAIEGHMDKMLAGEVEPYSAGWEIWGIAGREAPNSTELLWPLWLIWGALTDWVENIPQEKAEAEKEMLRAAREWLSLDQSDSIARKSYLDSWVYDEMGYERKAEPSTGANGASPRRSV